jgi:hypothetical protein
MYYGEVDKGKEDGIGIRIFNFGDIHIGSFEHDEWSTGNYILIHEDGVFKVGECYWKDEKKWKRGTQYKTDGTE